jgi:hypothetical protein
MRADTAMGLVHVSECQWGQTWLDASARGDKRVAADALHVLDGIADWWSAQAGIVGHGAFLGLDRMHDGDPSGIQRFEDANCAWTGSWGATPSQQDAKATRDLGAAILIAARYLRDGEDATGFDPRNADQLEPSIFWTSSDEQPAPAHPGAIFIASSPKGAVTLVSVSETGTQFCAVVGETSVVRGTTLDDLSVIDDGDGPHAVDPGPIVCVPGG